MYKTKEAVKKMRGIVLIAQKKKKKRVIKEDSSPKRGYLARNERQGNIFFFPISFFN